MIEAPIKDPTKNVTAAADPPAADILSAPQKTFLFENKATAAPTINNAAKLKTKLNGTTESSARKKYGPIGMNAPIENEKNELILAPHGEPSCRGFNPNFSLITVSNAASGVAMTLPANVMATSLDIPLA